MTSRMGGSHGGEEDLGDMQKRFQMLEGDRKALFETTQMTIKQNKEMLAAIKKENKELRQSLAQLIQDSAKKEGKDTDVGRLEKDVSELRRKYDDVRHHSLKRSRELNTLSDKLRDIEKENVRLMDQDTPLTRQIRTLENRLDKAMIKYNEAQSIRKTYEQIVKRLKEERIGFDNQLAAIERTLKAKEKDLEELVLMSHDAQHAKEVSKGELAKLEQQLAEERAQRQKELEDRKQMVQQRQEMNKRMEKREKMRRDMQAEAAGDLSADGEVALKKTLYANAMQSAMTESKLEEEEKKITTYEDAFRKIKDATGVSDVNEVIQKFLTQDETHNNLVAMTKEAQARIDQLNEEKNLAKSKVEELKYSGTGSLGSRRIVDEFESHLSEANGKCERNKQKFERVAKVLINVKAGVEHLADKVEHLDIGQQPIVLTDDTVVEVLQQCELKLMKLLESVQEDAEETDGRSSPEKTVPAADIEMPAFNMRVNLPHDLGDDDDDDEFEDDDQEDVPDRDAVKRYSLMMLEKANKKHKRQKKKKAKADSPRGAASRGGRAGME